MCFITVMNPQKGTNPFLEEQDHGQGGAIRPHSHLRDRNDLSWVAINDSDRLSMGVNAQICQGSIKNFLNLAGIRKQVCVCEQSGKIRTVSAGST